MPLLDAPMLTSLLIIGLTSFVLSILGFLAGRRFAILVGRKLDLLGGLLLVFIGVFVLVEGLQTS